MRIVLTGGSGFIGGHVLESLREAGHTVLNLDQKSGDVTADICDTAALVKVFGEFHAEFVFHLAGIADARRALADPVGAVQTNVGGTASVLDAARHSGVRRVVLASTCWVANAMNVGILDETSPFLAKGGGHVYTTTKVAAEHLCHDFQTLHGLPFTILRYGIPYGPRMWSGLVLKNFLEAAFAGKPLTVYGDGSALRRFVYVGDLARAHTLVLRDIAANQVYNLEGMRFVSVRELAELVSSLLGGVEIVFTEEPRRVGELQYFRKILSVNKAYIELGWQPEVDLPEGLSRTIEWYRSQQATKVQPDGARPGVVKV